MIAACERALAPYGKNDYVRATLRGTVQQGTRVDRALLTERAGAQLGALDLIDRSVVADYADARARTERARPRDSVNCSRPPTAATRTRAARWDWSSRRSTARRSPREAAPLDGRGLRPAWPGARSRSATGSTSSTARTRPANRRSRPRSSRRSTASAGARTLSGRGTAAPTPRRCSTSSPTGGRSRCSAITCATEGRARLRSGRQRRRRATSRSAARSRPATSPADPLRRVRQRVVRAASRASVSMRHATLDRRRRWHARSTAARRKTPRSARYSASTTRARRTSARRARP